MVIVVRELFVLGETISKIVSAWSVTFGWEMSMGAHFFESLLDIIYRVREEQLGATCLALGLIHTYAMLLQLLGLLNAGRASSGSRI